MKNRIALFLFFVTTGLCGVAQTSTVVDGSVVDNLSNPVPRATIHILNSNYGSFSDAHGKFSIPGVLPGRYILQVSAIGFATIRQAITVGSGSNEPVTATLKPSSAQLDAVIVTAQKKGRRIAENSI